MHCFRDTLPAQFEFYDDTRATWLEARVPGCIHTDLRRHGLIPDPFAGRNEADLQWIEQRDWRYRTRFDVSQSRLCCEHVHLVFDGLDTLAEVKLNGCVIGRTENMFVRHEWEVRALLLPTGNLLEVTFFNTLDYLATHVGWQPLKERNDPVGGRSRIRKEQCQYSWDWGPRFVTCGIWQPVRLESWNGARLDHVHLQQTHLADGTVSLRLSPELTGATGTEHFTATLSLRGQSVAAVAGGAGELVITLRQPELWWPAGQGAQPLYQIKVDLHVSDSGYADSWIRRTGFRTIELVREKDAEGETFYFRVNGRPIFAKGANWIPDHAFVTECNRERFAARLGAAVDAHMNMIRVWGGGIYEFDSFYDLCDELGLLVWQDFMFACALYPGAADYCDVLRPEVAQQVRRLQHRASLALWCGNNEVPMIPELGEALRANPAQASDYARIFHEVIPEIVEQCDGITPYWPSSPWTPGEYFADTNDGRAGDVHYWKVWHSRAPVKSYEGLRVRFCSEFGMQSYASLATAQTFCPAEELNVFSPIMESHQKNGGGNATMLHYMVQRYRYVSRYENLAYLSQLSQAYCMKVGVEHLRFQMPHTMGALYWQLNDCWPVASWSSIEFNGRWKALHHEARRFFAPSLLYLRTEGDVTIGRYNEVTEGINCYTLYTIHDAPEPRQATLVWSIRDFQGGLVGDEQRRELTLEPGRSASQAVCTLPDVVRSRRGALYLRAELLDRAGAVLSRQNAFFTVPRFLSLADPGIGYRLEVASDGTTAIRLKADSFAHAVSLSFGQLDPWLSDNWFDLHPGEERVIALRSQVESDCPVAPGSPVTIKSLWHSFQE